MALEQERREGRLLALDGAVEDGAPAEDDIRTKDDADAVVTVRMVEPNAMIRGCLLSDFCGIVASSGRPGGI